MLWNERTNLACRLVAVVGASALGAGAHAQWSPELWRTAAVAPTGPGYVRADGYASSSYVGVNNAGDVLGLSLRYAGSAGAGTVAWLWSDALGLRLIGPFGMSPTNAQGQSTVTPQLLDRNGRAAGVEADYSVPIGGEIAWVRRPDGTAVTPGLTDAEHTGSFRRSRPVALGPQDLVVGTSVRLGNEFDRGTSLWSWRPDTGTVRMGYFDALYTRPSNYKSTTLLGILDDGTVCGQSEMGVMHPTFFRYGSSAWVWSAAGGTERIGLTGGEYQVASGYQRSVINGVSPLGTVAGISDRFAGGADRGQSAWVYRRGSGEGSQRIGLLGTGYQYFDGSHTSVVKGVSPSGTVAGWTGAYNDSGGTYFGNDAWVWEAGMGTVRTGLYDSAHVHPLGERNSAVVRVYPGGVVSGTSRRAPSTPQVGQSAWVWSRATGTVRVGLFDAAHTLENGSQSSEVFDFGDGCVVGTSASFTAPTTTGVSHWVWTKQRGTRRVGLWSAGYGGSSYFIASNSRGQLVGTTGRPRPGGQSAGTSGWFYDPASDTVTALEFYTSSDGRVFTQPEALTEDGVVIGTYFLYDTGESRAFIWSLDRGFLDVTTLVPGGWPNPQWLSVGSHYGSAGRTVVLRSSQPSGSSPRNLPFILTAPALFDLCAAADIGGAGGLTPGDGQLDNNDFIVFIGWFFGADVRADRGSAGGLPGGDGQLDNNDFIVFISEFFQGC